eukprot:scaffold7052_cov254-Pinguiococcus_pyrenoidosus.AAC.108
MDPLQARPRLEAELLEVLPPLLDRLEEALVDGTVQRQALENLDEPVAEQLGQGRQLALVGALAKRLEHLAVRAVQLACATVGLPELVPPLGQLRNLLVTRPFRLDRVAQLLRRFFAQVEVVHAHEHMLPPFQQERPQDVAAAALRDQRLRAALARLALHLPQAVLHLIRRHHHREGRRRGQSYSRFLFIHDPDDEAPRRLWRVEADAEPNDRVALPPLGVAFDDRVHEIVQRHAHILRLRIGEALLVEQLVDLGRRPAQALRHDGAGVVADPQAVEPDAQRGKARGDEAQREGDVRLELLERHQVLHLLAGAREHAPPQLPPRVAARQALVRFAAALRRQRTGVARRHGAAVGTGPSSSPRAAVRTPAGAAPRTARRTAVGTQVGRRGRRHGGLANDGTRPELHRRLLRRPQQLLLKPGLQLARQRRFRWRPGRPGEPSHAEQGRGGVLRRLHAGFQAGRVVQEHVSEERLVRPRRLLGAERRRSRSEVLQTRRGTATGLRRQLKRVADLHAGQDLPHVVHLVAIQLSLGAGRRGVGCHEGAKASGVGVGRFRSTGDGEGVL